MANYKMNFATKTLTISREFSNKAIACPNSKEYQIMEQCRSLCPDLKIAYFTRRSSSSKPYGGMTYTKMENYIKLYENADELLERFSVKSSFHTKKGGICLLSHVNLSVYFE